MAHTLQLAVIDSLKDSGIEKILNKVRSLVKKLRNQTYIYIIKKEKLKFPILDCLTRWHSTLDMLERVKHLKNFIQTMASNDTSLKKVCLNNSEWNQIEVISKALLPSKICTKKFQNEQLTLTDFYGAWILCKIQTKKFNTSFSDKLVECLTNREEHLMKNKVLLAAIFLDPRYKITLDDEQFTTAINHLIGVWLQLKKLEEKIVDITMNNKNLLLNIDSEDDSITGSDGLEDFLKEKDNVDTCNPAKSSQTSTSYTIETTLKAYHIKQTRLSHKVNILKFWKSMENIYPEIYVLAKIILSVPSTQVSVERLFSGLKFILSPYRSNINAQNLEDQLLVRTNRLFDKADNEYIKKK